MFHKCHERIFEKITDCKNRKQNKGMSAHYNWTVLSKTTKKNFWIRKRFVKPLSTTSSDFGHSCLTKKNTNQKADQTIF